MICRTFDVLYREGETSGRVMPIALHPYISGVPHRIGALDAALEYICRHPGVWRTTGARSPSTIWRSSRPEGSAAMTASHRRLHAAALAALCVAALAAPGARAAETILVGSVGSASANLWPVMVGDKKGSSPPKASRSTWCTCRPMRA